MLLVASPPRASHWVPGRSRSGFTLAAAVLGFFVITLDAVVVNVALPSIRADLGGGVTGLQWVVDGYTLMFAGLLLTAGALSDRVAPAAPSPAAWRCSRPPRPPAGWHRPWAPWSRPGSSRVRPRRC